MDGACSTVLTWTVRAASSFGQAGNAQIYFAILYEQQASAWSVSRTTCDRK